MIFLSPAGSRADQLKGDASVQYQSTDNTAGFRSYLTRGFEINHFTQIGKEVNVRTRVEFRQSSFMQGQSGTITPRGSIQVTHHLFGLNVAYRPTRTTDNNGFETNTDQTMFNGYVGIPRLPRLDFNWTRRHTSPSESTRGGAGITRSAQLTRSIGRLNLHTGYGDQALQRAAGGSMRLSQQNMTGGASFQAISARTMSLLMVYDFSRARSIALTGGSSIVRTHNATLSSGYKLSTKTDVGLNYSYRRSEIRSSIRNDDNNHDGTLLLNYRPTAGTRFMTGGGLHTTVDIDNHQFLAGNLVAAADVSGRVRPGWKGQAGISRTMRRPQGHLVAVDTWTAGSTFQFAPRLSLSTNLLMTSNGDSAVRNSRDVAQISYDINAAPVPGFRAVWQASLYRSGPSFTRALAHSTSRTLNLQWKPASGFEFGAVFSRAAALPTGTRISTTSRYTARWNSIQSIQLDLSYARSNERRSGLGLDGLVGRKMLGARLLMAPGRRNRVSAGINIADPGRATRTQQIDVTVTRNFGR